MNDYSLLEKLKILMNIIVSSPFFLICFISALLILIFFVIASISNTKINKWIIISVWGIDIIAIMIIYHSVLFDIIDSIFDYVFMALYFPSFTVYFSFLLISNFFFIYSIFNKKVTKLHKILNISSACIMNLFLIFIIDIVTKTGINIQDALAIYSNQNLLVLLELNSAIFVSWILLNLFISAYYKLQKYDNKKLPDMPEIIFE